MNLIAPDYLSFSTLPRSTDIFYFDKITYSLPTGFTPEEIKSVYEFPEYCFQKSIALPQVFWDYCKAYFVNTEEAYKCISILSPIREKVKFTYLIYGRDRAMINECLKRIELNPLLYEGFKCAYNNIPFIAREFISHLLFEVVIESGYSGANDYLQYHLSSSDLFFKLVASTLINRFNCIKEANMKILIYNHEWIPLLKSCGFMEDSKSTSYYNDVEFFTYKLFESIVFPLFGKCDSEKQSDRIFTTSTNKRYQISSLKKLCGDIALDVIQVNQSNSAIVEKELRYRIQKDILSPLSEIMESPHAKMSNFFSDFLFDSTLFAGIISCFNGFNVETIITSVAASALSSGSKYLKDFTNRRTFPSRLLLHGLKTSSIRYIEYSGIIENLQIPKYPF